MMFRILVLVAALAAGGIAAWLSFSVRPGLTPGPSVAAPGPQIRTQDVLVAAADLAQGAVVTDKDVRWQAWPEQSVNPSFISRPDRPDAVENLSGSIVRQAVAVGEPIRDDKLATNASGFLAAVLPSGMRAVAVRVSAESAAGGFILPNDRVDVLHTSQHGGHSRTILTNVRVLAIDQKALDSGTERDTAVGKTATLELKPDQAEALAAARATGSISLALRALADNNEAPSFARRNTGVVVHLVRAGQTETVQTEGPVK